MSKAEPANQRPLRAAAAFLGWACVFGAAYCQAPLYYSNQNQYFLHGLAAAGEGFLSDDWLANTEDPTPLFSLLVATTARYLTPAAFYAYYVLLFGIYFASVSGIFAELAGGQDSPRLRLVFAALLLAVHSALARWCSYRWGHLDYPWYFQAGVAGQYILGAMLQPSTFGVLLVLSLYLLVRDRLLAAAATACVAAAMHSTYVLPAGMLTAGYLVSLVGERRFRDAVVLGLSALVLVAPVVVYVLLTFRPASAESMAEANYLLAYVRIPHHSQPQLWCDPIAVGQIVWILVGIGLARGTRLFPVMSTAFLFAAALTLVQVYTGSDFLALLFPWRVSAVLVPVATAIILSRLVLTLAQRLDRPAVAAASAAAIGGLAAAGVAIMYLGAAFQSGKEEKPLLDWVRANKAKGDVYLIPVQVPPLARTTRGSLSSDFKPAADKKRDARLIPLDFQRFRLDTGAPIYVDFKSIPYRDVEVLEWWRRIQTNGQLYEHLSDAQTVRARLMREQITHVVLPADRPLGHEALQLVYQDEYYRVFRLPVPGQSQAAPVQFQAQ